MTLETFIDLATMAGVFLSFAYTVHVRRESQRKEKQQEHSKRLAAATWFRVVNEGFENAADGGQICILPTDLDVLYSGSPEVGPNLPDQTRVTLLVQNKGSPFLSLVLGDSPHDLKVELQTLVAAHGEVYTGISYLWSRQKHGQSFRVRFGYRSPEGQDYSDRYTIKIGFAQMERIDPPLPR